MTIRNCFNRTAAASIPKIPCGLVTEASKRSSPTARTFSVLTLTLHKFGPRIIVSEENGRHSQIATRCYGNAPVVRSSHIHRQPQTYADCPAVFAKTAQASARFMQQKGLYFQQPTGADSPTDPVSEFTRFEQQGMAIERTRLYLDEVLNINS